MINPYLFSDQLLESVKFSVSTAESDIFRVQYQLISHIKEYYDKVDRQENVEEKKNSLIKESEQMENNEELKTDTKDESNWKLENLEKTNKIESKPEEEKANNATPQLPIGPKLHVLNLVWGSKLKENLFTFLR